MEWGDTAGWLAEEDNAIEPSLSGGGGRVQGTRIALGQAASGAVCLGAGKDRVPEAYVVVVHGRRRGRRLRVRAMLKLNNGRTAVSPLRGSGAVGAEAYLEGIDSSRWATAVAAAASMGTSPSSILASLESCVLEDAILWCFDFYSIDRKFCNGTNLNTLYQYHWSMRLSTGSWHSWYPVKHTEIKVVSIENSEVLADGSKGVVKVRGPQVMKGYYKDHFFQFTDANCSNDEVLAMAKRKPILDGKPKDKFWNFVDNGLLTSTLKIRRDKFRSANETVDHLFVSCPLARFACNVIASAFGLEKINSIQHLLEAWLNEFDKKKKQLVAVGIAATLLWAYILPFMPGALHVSRTCNLIGCVISILHPGKGNADEVDGIRSEDVACLICQELLFDPSVLNCGHVYCMPCLTSVGGEELECQFCGAPHPAEPTVCSNLKNFLKHRFEELYNSRQEKSSGVPSRKEGTRKGKPSEILHTHVGVGCDGCGVFPIQGRRYSCKECEAPGLDLCEKCFMTGSTAEGRFDQKHTADHDMELDDSFLFPNLVDYMDDLYIDMT
ncbi:hypothetical protein OsJ_29989 [Oryza sativa Japonica Group]|uniref:Uncharacterized protein n=1 Tax=Oryza sativa subsp. japonica TaxID=39947 RepID=B9G4I8_ORYSJ|nr:hypothetical protein OsJ_29989 [Oryza sativa Japonica Group]